MAQTTFVRVYPDDRKEINKLRLKLSAEQGKDISSADVIRWLVELAKGGKADAN